jgi:threonyl-tRNA synthetase
MAIMIEHYAGAFPLWLSPVQLAIIPVSDSHNDYAYNVYNELKAHDLRVEIDTNNDSMGKKIRNAKQAKLPYFIVIGDKEVADNTVTLESRDTGASETLTLNALTDKLTAEADA